MRIRKIRQIQNLGVFKDFNWDNNCPEFKQFNFFYGWNYSGKTTLSRLFRCLEGKTLHPDYPTMKFQIESDQGYISEKDVGKGFHILVFNEDFVEENFKWNDENHRINPILILGRESIELQEKLKEAELKKQKIEEEKTQIEKELTDKRKLLENNLTNKASEIRNILGITNFKEFDKGKFEDKIKDIKPDISKHILSNEEENEKISLYRTQVNFEFIETLSLDLKAFSTYQKVKSLCEKPITAQQIIEKLKNNPELNQWVRKGLDLHKNEEYCQFCGNKLPDDLFDKLNKHFSEEYDKLIQELSFLEEQIDKHREEIYKINFTDKARFYPKFAEPYEQKREELKKSLENEYGNLLNNLVHKIREKRNRPFESINIDLDITELEHKINNYISEINSIIKDNNSKISQLSNEKEEIKKKLINHYVAKAVEEMKYFDLKEEIEEMEKIKKEKEQELNKILEEINAINSDIKQAIKGAEAINTYLKQFFGDDQLKLIPFDDGGYQVQRAGNIAKNLSAGEKNIISLVYFITKLEENNCDKSNTIVFIDDPVSSLDSNHTFQVFGFLEEKLKDCGQVFITTHNFDFYNLLKDVGMNERVNYYLIKRVQTNVDKISTISELPAVLRKFKSEYNYLFSILKEFKGSTDKNNYEMLYALPNIARRFLELYLFARYPDSGKFKDKADKFFKDYANESEKRTTLKILDEYSHEQNPEHIRKFPETNEIITAIKTILTILENKDKEHYDALSESIK